MGTIGRSVSAFPGGVGRGSGAKGLRLREASTSTPRSAARRAVEGSDVVVNAADTGSDLDVMRASLGAGAPLRGLGGLFHVTRSSSSSRRVSRRRAVRHPRLGSALEDEPARRGCGAPLGDDPVSLESGRHARSRGADQSSLRRTPVQTLRDELQMRRSPARRWSRRSIRCPERRSASSRPVGRAEGATRFTPAGNASGEPPDLREASFRCACRRGCSRSLLASRTVSCRAVQAVPESVAVHEGRRAAGASAGRGEEP